MARGDWPPPRLPQFDEPGTFWCTVTHVVEFPHGQRPSGYLASLVTAISQAVAKVKLPRKARIIRTTHSGVHYGPAPREEGE